MLEPTLPASTIEQARLELSVAASASERANRPRLYLVGAIALLIVAVIYTLVGLSSLRSSLAAVSRARGSADEIITLTDKVKGLQKTLAERGLDPNPRLAASLEELARLSGTTLVGQITDTPGTATGQVGMSQRRYTARFVNQPPAALLQFLNITQEDPATAGVEFSRLNLKPGVSDGSGNPAGWDLDVEFTRWERISGR